MNLLYPCALGLSSLLLAGCMASESAGTDTTDLFPKPLGEKILPLENQATYSKFNYIELDGSGAVVMRDPALTLTITKRGPDLYGYAFETPNQGHLLLWKDGGGNPDSAGIFIAGHFQDTVNFLDSVPTLWLPHRPKAGMKWALDSARTMELITADTALYTDVLFSYGSQLEKAPVSYGFQRQTTLLFRETAGDTVTYYHFGRGIGCLAFERSINGHLSAAGTIISFYGYFTGITRGD